VSSGAPPASGGGTARPAWVKPVGRALALLVAVASVVFVALTLVHDRGAASRALGHADLRWLVPAYALAAASLVYSAWRWGAAIVAVGGHRGPLSRVIAAFFVGELAKYVPGGIWSVLGRSEIARREGRPRTIAYASVILSLIAWYLAAAVTALALAAYCFASGTVGTSWWPAVAAIVVLGFAVLHPAVHGRLLTFVQRAFRRKLELDLPSWSACVRLAASYVPTWIGIAAATTMVAHALEPRPQLARVALAAIVSWIIGFVSPSPSGIGVREAVFIATAGLPAGPAAAAAVLARLMFVLSDVFGAGLGSLVLRARRPQPGAAVEQLTALGAEGYVLSGDPRSIDDLEPT
jgi:glycosyltransferase 2 family protein